MTTKHAITETHDLEDFSGIHPRIEVERFLDAVEGSDPSPLYLCFEGRRFYLGTRFPTGIIAAESWDDEMQAAGVPDRLIVGTFNWLARRAI